MPERPLTTGGKIGLTAEILYLYGRVRWLLPRHSLPEVVARLRAGAAARAGPSAPTAPGHLSSAVQRVLARLPTDSRCLIRSAVLLAVLARRSLDCTFVIAVRTGPTLAAHAWIERDGRSLLPPGGAGYERIVEL